MSGNLVELVGARAAGRADHPFLRALDGTVWSYGDVLARAARYAAALRGLGVQPDDRVAVQVDKSAEVLALYLGCLHLGAVFLPLNTAYTEAEVAYFLGDAEPQVAVCRPTAAEAFGRIAASGSAAHVETMGADGSGSMATRADQADPDLPVAPRAAGDLAAILYTSGTTGRSKGAMLTHGNLTSNADSLIGAWRFSAEDVLLHALPLFHSHGLFVASNVVLLSSASMILLPAFDVDAVLAELPAATVLMGVPTHYVRLLADPRLTSELVRHVRLFTSGSAPLSPEHHRAFSARTGHAILERYGMTETNMNTSNPYDGERRPGTVGFPLPGVEIRVVAREGGDILPEGEVGIVEVRGPNVFRGYWRMPDRTATELHDDGFFVTGDLGRVDGDGYLWLVGRDKDLIISGGLNVYPAEVEAALDALPGIAESAVVGVAHPDLGEGVTAVVVAEPSAEVEEASVRSRLAQGLAGFKVPKRVVVVDELPRNAMGKVEKAVLRRRFAGLFPDASEADRDRSGPEPPPISTTPDT